MTGGKIPSNILVIKLGALGDVIQALGPMAAIRRHHAGDRIMLLTTKPFENLARQSKHVDDVILDERPKWHDLKGWLDLKKKLAAGNFSRVYDLQNNDRTALYLRLMPKGTEWVGAAKGASHRNASPERTKGRAYDGHVQTLGLAGINDVRVDDLAWMTDGKTPDGLQPPYVLVVPGSAPAHLHKRWPADKYAELCRRLTGAGYRPVLIGSVGEKDVLDAIEQAAPSALNLCGKTALFDIPALARNAAAAVGNDTGPMHLIAPTGCPTLVLFSKHTLPHRHAPLGASVSFIQVDDLRDLAVEHVAVGLFENLQQKPS